MAAMPMKAAMRSKTVIWNIAGIEGSRQLADHHEVVFQFSFPYSFCERLEAAGADGIALSTFFTSRY